MALGVSLSVIVFLSERLFALKLLFKNRAVSHPREDVPSHKQNNILFLTGYTSWCPLLLSLSLSLYPFLPRWVLLINRVLNSWIANALMWVINLVCVCVITLNRRFVCVRVCVYVVGDFTGTGAGLSTFRRVAKEPRGLSVMLIHSFIHWARERVVHQRHSLVLSQVPFSPCYL